MTVFRSLILGVVAICLVGYGVEAGGLDKAKSLIVGKWKMEKTEKLGGDKELTISIAAEFSKDGKMKLAIKVGDPVNMNFDAEGTYKFIDEKTLETEIAPPGKKEAEKDKLTIDTLTKEKLVLSHEKKGKAETMIFKRVK